MSADRTASLGERLRAGLEEASAAGVDISGHRRAIERRLDAMTRKVAARHTPRAD